MLPHYPASVEWATVGGYIAARGSGVLSTRYGKIEDLRAVAARRDAGRRADRHGRRPAPRRRARAHAAVRRLGGHARRDHARDAASSCRCRRSAASPPSRSRRVGAGIDAIRRALQLGHRPSVVRMYDEEATRLTFAPGRRRGPRAASTPCSPSRARPRRPRSRSAGRSRSPREAGAELLDPALGQRWWDRRYDFYHPPHQPELPAIWGTLDVVATYARIEAVYDALHTAVREPYATPGSSCGCTSRTGTRGAR